MLPTSDKLRLAIASGIRQIGEIAIESNASNARFKLCHHEDLERSSQADGGGLTVHNGPAAARELGSHAADGSYRFLKAQTNLRRGWVMVLESAADLRLALDQFYPACVGLWLAQQDGTLEIEHLRDKLSRQSGMYRRAKALSDAALQALVSSTCSPAMPCARRILWQLDAHTPLRPGAASQCRGIAAGIPESAAIPLLCREPCNHFVAEGLAAAKAGHTPAGAESKSGNQR
ncbi:MAG: DR2241 family protein [Verrucomicrobia bacterium]|nr:DR2241 family protein [Verrucomicrobiota bacterium]